MLKSGCIQDMPCFPPKKSYIGLVDPRLPRHRRVRPDFTSNLIHVLAFGTPKFFISPHGKINHGLVHLSSNCGVKSGLSVSDMLDGCIALLTYLSYVPCSTDPGEKNCPGFNTSTVI